MTSNLQKIRAGYERFFLQKYGRYADIIGRDIGEKYGRVKKFSKNARILPVFIRAGSLHWRSLCLSVFLEMANKEDLDGLCII